MSKAAKKLLVVITEAALERTITQSIKQAGATGYTVHDVHGSGKSGERHGDTDLDRSIEIKVICDAALAEQLAQDLLRLYASHWRMTLYVADVAVFRADHF